MHYYHFAFPSQSPEKNPIYALGEMVLPWAHNFAVHKTKKAGKTLQEGTKPTSPKGEPTGGSLMSYRSKFKTSLFVGSSIIAFAALAATAQAQNTAAADTEQVIVTGSRVQGMTAADSAEPVTVVDTTALSQGVGSTDLRQALGTIIPSFTAQQYANDTAEFSLSAALRGLSPNDTLVLVDGHRRHYTGNLAVDGGNFASGSAPADLSLIPEAAVDHIEVLTDGAASGL